jgi:hypothetical protein
MYSTVTPIAADPYFTQPLQVLRQDLQHRQACLQQTPQCHAGNQDLPGNSFQTPALSDYIMHQCSWLLP